MAVEKRTVSLDSYVGKIVLYPLGENNDGTENYARVEVVDTQTDPMFERSQLYIGSIVGRVLGETTLGTQKERESFPVFTNTELFVAQFRKQRRT